MNIVRRHIVLISILGISSFLKVLAQDKQNKDLSYQIILQTEAVYNDADNKSKVNPENWMKITDFSSLSHFYPILEFSNTFNNITTKLQAEGDIKSYNLDKDSTSFSFQELYGQISIKDKHHFILGKKRLDWGSGMIWNPTNFFIQKDPLRTQNRLEGIFMINYSYIYKKGALNLYVFPEKQFEDCSFALKCDYTNDRIDGSLSVVKYKKYEQFGYDISYGGDKFTAYSEGVLKNYTKSYLVNESGDLITPNSRKKRFRSEFVAGTSILFNNHVSFNGEYRFREDYLNRKNVASYKFYTPTNSLLFDPISVGKHTLFGSISYKDTYDKWSANLRSFYDPVSNQLLVSPLGTFTLDNFQIETSLIIYNNSLSINKLQGSVLLSYFF